jgi:hypothetical protein
MNNPSWPRRDVFALAAGMSALAGAAAAAKPARLLYDLASPQDQLTAMVKVRGSLVAEDVPQWYFGTIYGVVPGKAPIPMIDLEGSEIGYYIKQPDGSYHAHAKTVSYFRDVKTRAYIESFTNPITGKVNTIRPNTIEGGKYYIYAVNGFMRSDEKDAKMGSTPKIGEYLKWTESGDWAWLNTQRPYPPGAPFGEAQSTLFPLAELHDPNLSRVKTTFGHPTYFSPWLPWMEMKDVPGHVVWAVNAKKMASVKDYPREFLAKVEKDFPDRLSAKPA